MVYLRPDAGHGEAVLAHGTITSSLRACADLALAADAVPETNGAILGTRCEVGIIACLGLGAPPEAKPAIASLRSSTPALGRKPRCQLDWCSGCRPNIVFGARPDVGRLTKEVRSCARDNLISKATSSAAA